MTSNLRDELLVELDKLPEATVRALLESLRRDPNRRVRNWSPAIGSMSDEDVSEMMRIIEEECERVDPDGW